MVGGISISISISQTSCFPIHLNGFHLDAFFSSPFHFSLRSSAFDVLTVWYGLWTMVWLNWNSKACVNHSKINILCVYTRPFGSDRRKTFDFGIVFDSFLSFFRSFSLHINGIRFIAMDSFFLLFFFHVHWPFFMAHKFVFNCTHGDVDAIPFIRCFN